MEAKKAVTRQVDAEPKPTKADPNEASALQALEAQIGELRRQLRLGEPAVLPDLIKKLLPEKPAQGQQRKIMEWRSFIVWGEWTGEDWDAVVYIAGKRL